MLGPTLFNIFVNNILYWVKESEILSFADDNTVSSAEVSVEKLLETLERKSQIATDCLRKSSMIVNAHKFQAFEYEQPINFQY